MKHLIQISIFIIVVQWCGEVKCRNIFKSFYLGIEPLPKHFSFVLEKLTPFGTYEFKHTIKKRQVLRTELPSPVINELQPVDDPLKVPLLEKTEVENAEKLPAEVLITSVVEPLEPGKPISFLLPVDSEVVITPAVKDNAAPIPLSDNIPVGIEPEIKPEVGSVLPSTILNITPKPVEIPLQEEVKLVEPNEVVTTPVENNVLAVPPLPPVPVVQPIPSVELVPALQNFNTPVTSPVINSIPIAPFLYTNIKGIPFYTPAANIIPFITPGAVPIPEAIVPANPPTVIKNIFPVIKEEVPLVVKQETPPVVKEDPPPNFLVKSSRFVLYFGSMMLQMLSRFVNGQVTPNQIPLPQPFPGMQ